MRTLPLLALSVIYACVPAAAQTPSLLLSPTSFTFTYNPGSFLPASQNLFVSSTGFGFNYSVSTTFASWLSVSPVNGFTPGTTLVTVNPFGLPVGTYSATIIVNAGFTQANVPVTLNVGTTGSGANVTPSSLAFSYTTGGAPPASQSVQVAVFQGSAVYSTAAFTTTGGTWLSVAPNAALAPSSITVSVSSSVIATLATGTYNGQVTIFIDGIDPIPIPVTLTVSAGGTTSGGRFVPLTPCRVADTRAGQGFGGSFGPPSLTAGSTRPFPIRLSNCGVPSAQAYALNITVVPVGPLQYLTAWPTGVAQPNTSTLNAFEGAITSNAAIVPAGTDGAINIFVTNQTDVIIDITGYFIDSASALALYPVSPCRIADTRNPAGPFGGPQLTASSTRDYNVPASSCNISTTAQAYSLNATVVPPGPLSFLTLFQTGQVRPNVSTLNSFEGFIKANAAIVPGGASGAISAFVTDRTDLVLDINGYFAPPGSPGGLRFFAVTPCRVVDTRNTGGAITGNTSRDFTIQNTCQIPTTAAAYSLNVTVVPSSALSFLTLWPAGSSRPLVSTLNSFQGRTLANAAIVPSGASGSVSVYASDTTHVILDINGYFAP
ncbi:MAG: BACON domain-containing protein [Acidobacteria bacterium]|nr:BACON domain-containing protein [Acidobacteriota bacterium]